MTREFFIAIDPITTVHMGICNAPQTIARAKALVAALKSRHLEFMEDSDNEEEYVATHYMDPQARLNVTQQRAAKRLASLPAVHSNSNSNKQLGTAGPAVNQDRAVNNLQSSSRSTAGAAASSAAGVRVHCDRDCEQVTTIGAYSQRQPQQHQSAISHEVTDFQLSDFEPATMPAADHKTATVPSLEAILLGEKCLLRAKGSNLSVVDCEQVYNILRRQGCRSTEHLVSLLQWQCADATQSGTDTRRNETDNMTSSIASLDKGRCFKVCVDLGIPAFHVMDLVVYLQEQLH